MKPVLWGNVIITIAVGVLAAFCEYNGLESEGLWFVFVMFALFGDFAVK